ncbi:ABC-2 type transport system ATP-binding protein [Ruminiclostridium sufflavum DSM 19573]|uniref:ABC-2 type transport system ATP-binding protein n=1 Tax=Ruminiclostridium sufflavum DSM 19573 TaxID=1121337 RepID=A0A318XL17_9FIRM|nr:ABC transporter ATP-binding protein [Ruminiclostridium sufflavum]PYG87251.1 ABC-2 type transport system ATP-binding protein [Ruminiclostridium sufflavum DSM 19573]
MIDVKSLSKSYGDFKALDELDIHINQGSVYGLLGPNGSGKTTLIKHLAGIYKNESGTIAIDDKTVFDNPETKAEIVYISDDLFYFSQYNIKEMADFYSSMYPTWSWDRFNTLRQVFPIDVKRRVTKLSKGMQKQVAFWLGISAKPKVMILDEPVDGLDPVMRKKVWNLVLQDVAEYGTTVLVSSHNLRELEDVCDHVGILYKGKMMVERELDNMKSDIHKIQLAYTGDIPSDIFKDIEILHKTKSGSVLQFIVRGSKDSIFSRVKSTNPVIMDILPLSLEEIFIYELGGKGYEIENILI